MDAPRSSLSTWQESFNHRGLAQTLIKLENGIITFGHCHEDSNNNNESRSTHSARLYSCICSAFILLEKKDLRKKHLETVCKILEADVSRYAQYVGKEMCYPLIVRLNEFREAQSSAAIRKALGYPNFPGTAFSTNALSLSLPASMPLQPKPCEIEVLYGNYIPSILQEGNKWVIRHGHAVYEIENLRNIPKLISKVKACQSVHSFARVPQEVHKKNEENHTAILNRLENLLSKKNTGSMNSSLKRKRDQNPPQEVPVESMLRIENILNSPPQSV